MVRACLTHQQGDLPRFDWLMEGLRTSEEDVFLNPPRPVLEPSDTGVEGAIPLGNLPADAWVPFP